MENNDNLSIALWRKILIGVIAFIGFLTTIELAVVYYNANFLDGAQASFCSINDFIDCDSVARTKDSQFLGVPLAYWGMFFYLFVGLLMASKKLSQYKLFKFLEVFKNPYSYIAGLGILAFIISMTLLFISLHQIQKLCILCVFTYILNLAIGLLALKFTKEGFLGIFKNSYKDFMNAIKVKSYLIAFICVVIFAGLFLTFTQITSIFAPQVPKIDAIQTFEKYKEKGINPYEVKGNILGTKDAKIKVHVYSDFRCPICSVYNIIINKVGQELENVEFIHHDYPLDMECNKYLQRPFHFGSCVLARYAYAAEQQGHYWDFSSQVYLTQPITDYDVWILAERMGMDLDKFKADAMSTEAAKKVLTGIEEAHALGLKGTPCITLNDSKELFMGAKTEDDLIEILVNAGAKEKSSSKSFIYKLKKKFAPKVKKQADNDK